MKNFILFTLSGLGLFTGVAVLSPGRAKAVDAPAEPTPTKTPIPTPASQPDLAKVGFTVVAKPTPKPGATPTPTSKDVGASSNVGANGANRRVFTPSNVQAVEGTFVMGTQRLGSPEFYIAPDVELGVDGYVSKINNPGINLYSNKPTFYFATQGGNGEFQAEVGFQYEGLIANNLPPGWSAYSSVTLSTYPPGVTDAKQKETVNNWYQSINVGNRKPNVPGAPVHIKVGLDKDGTFDMNVGQFPLPVKKGKAEGEGVGLNIPYYSPQLYPQFLYASDQKTVNTSGISFRRVVGMTQANGQLATDSNAYLRNLRFEGGKMWAWGSSTSQDWAEGGHEYVPDYKNVGLFYRVDGKLYPLFKVDSAVPWQRQLDGKSSETPNVPDADKDKVPSRYVQETVNINLLAPSGEVEPAGITAGTGKLDKKAK